MTQYVTSVGKRRPNQTALLNGHVVESFRYVGERRTSTRERVQ
jgi:hypothetical protein